MSMDDRRHQTLSPAHATGLDRRGFVKRSAAALGSLAVAPLATTPSARAITPLPEGRTVSPRPGANPIRIGLIGCGGRGTGAAAQALSSGQRSTGSARPSTRHTCE